MKDVTQKDVVSFKGTRQGILMSILENEAFSKAIEELTKKFNENKSFFAGSPISLDLGWRELEEEELSELLVFFQTRDIKLLGIISTSLNTRKVCEDRGIKVIIGRLGLADHQGRQKWTAQRRPSMLKNDRAGSSPPKKTIDDKNSNEIKNQGETVMIKKTVRSGQSASYPGNLVVMGDVNPGGEVKAGGDIIIIGALRGVAWAGASSSNALKSKIVALKFQPTQIRIGEHLQNKFDKKFTRSKQPVVAQLKKNNIELTIY